MNAAFASVSQSCLLFLLLRAGVRSVLKLLVAKPALSSLKLDFIPWLTRHQLKHSQPAAAAAGGFAGRASAGGAAAGGATGSSFLLLSRQHSGGSFGSLTSAGSLTAAGMPAAAADGGNGSSGAAAGSGTGNSSSSAAAAGSGGAAGGQGSKAAAAAAAGSNDGDGEGGHAAAQPPMPGDGFMALSHSGSAAASSRAGRVGVYLVPEGHYCARVNTVQAYGDVNREVGEVLRQQQQQHLAGSTSLAGSAWAASGYAATAEAMQCCVPCKLRPARHLVCQHCSS